MPLSLSGSVFSLWVVAVMACYLDWCFRLQDIPKGQPALSFSNLAGPVIR